MMTPGARLRAAWQAGPIMIPGAFNALTARLAERLGFQAVYLSGGALSAGWAGLPDIGLLTQTEFAEQAAVLARATALPVLCDADTGFGEAIHVERTDPALRGGRGRRVAPGGPGAAQALRPPLGQGAGGPRDDGGQDPRGRRGPPRPRFRDRRPHRRPHRRGLRRRRPPGREYLAAGADMIFPEALESADEFARFAREVPAPLLANMTEFGRSPLIPFDELASLGFRAAIYPLTAFRAAMRAAEETLRALREHGTQRDLIDRMQTRAELYDLLGYSDWEERDQAYFTAGAKDTADRPGL